MRLLDGLGSAIALLRFLDGTIVAVIWYKALSKEFGDNFAFILIGIEVDNATSPFTASKIGT